MCVRRGLLNLLVMLALGWNVPVAVAGQTRTEADRTRDLLQTMQARKLLRDEPELAGLNIGVTVRNRVATLWGPVASAEIAFRAELCLRTMIELVEVRSELFVSDQLEENRPAAKLKITPLAPELLPPTLPTERRPALTIPELQTPQEMTEPKPKAPTAIKVARPQSPAQLTLGVPQADRLTAAERELETSVRTLLQAKSTFRDIQFALKDGRVYLKTVNAETDVLHEAARAISRLPNVEGVIVLEKMR